MPPLNEVWLAVLNGVLFPGGAALLVVGLMRWWPALGAGLALIGAWGVGVYRTQAVAFWPETTGWQSVGVLTVVAVVTGWLHAWPRTPRPLAEWLRGAVVIVAAGLLVSPGLRAAHAWAVPTLALVSWTTWHVVTALAQRHPGGLVPLALAFTANVVGVVNIFAHSGSLADAGNILFAGLGAVALAAWWWRADVSAGVAGAFAVAVPTLALGAYFATSSQLPPYTFALAPLAPLLAGLTLLAPASTTRTRLALVVGLWLVPLLGAVGLCVAYESLPTADEGW
jgi:hypothetical protein